MQVKESQAQNPDISHAECARFAFVGPDIQRLEPVFLMAFVDGRRRTVVLELFLLLWPGIARAGDQRTMLPNSDTFERCYPAVIHID